jgi:hypothetical protein
MVPDLFLCTGLAIAQTVSTTKARDQSQVKSCGICGGQSGAGEHYLRVLQFSLPILISSIAPFDIH